MKDFYTIGLDYGTLSGRAILVRLKDGLVVAEASMDYPNGIMDSALPDGSLLMGNDQAYEHPGDYLDVLSQVVHEVIKQSEIDKEQIIGLGIDFTSCTMLPIDQNGVPLCMQEKWKNRQEAYAKLWKHHGAQSQADEINALLEREKLIDQLPFGGRISSELMVPKIMETFDRDPDVFEEADEFVEAGDWLTRVLTGTNGRSCSMAGYKMWWTERMGYPSTDLLGKIRARFANLPREKMPGKVFPMGSCIGQLTGEWAEKLGLKEGIAVAPAIIDSHAGVPGSGVYSPKQMMMVLGTSSVVIALSKKPFCGSGIVGGVKDAVVPGYYAFESGLAAVGDLYGWFVNEFVPESIHDRAKKNGTDIFTWLNQEAGKEQPGESGLIALDWWNGNKTPYVDGMLRGCLVGMTLRTSAAQIYRALIEATAFATKQIIDLYEQNGVAASELIASGGIAVKNPFVMQLYADILGKTITVVESSQAAALGSAIYASLAAGSEKGGYDQYDQAVIHMGSKGKWRYTPNHENTLIYQKLYTIYKKYGQVMGETNRDIMRDLSDIHKD